MKRKEILTAVTVITLVLILGTVLTNKGVASQNIPNKSFKYISDIQKTTHDLQALRGSRLTLENTAIVPKIAPREAVDAACHYLPGYANQAKSIVVEYYQLTNPGITAFSDAAKQKNQSLLQNGYLLKAPCYIVSFEGITRHGSAPNGFQAPIWHEYNLIVDAGSGEILYGYAYR